MAPRESTLPFWTLVGKLQHTANKPHLDLNSWVAEEQLDELLARPEPTDLIPAQVNRLRRQGRYRRRKLINRSRLLRAYIERTRAGAELPHARELADDVRRLVSVADWRLLNRLAEGESYEQLAAERGTAVGTLKSYVCRLRQDIRRQCPM